MTYNLSSYCIYIQNLILKRTKDV